MLKAARDANAEWTLAALEATTPAEMLAAHFSEQRETSDERAARLAREAMLGQSAATAPLRRFRVNASARWDCEFRVEDASAAVEEEVRDDESGHTDEATKFDLILCRYSIFLYAEDETTATAALTRIVSRLAPEGILLLGSTDALPTGATELLEPMSLAAHGSSGDGAPNGGEVFDCYSRRLPPVNAFRLKQQQHRGGQQDNDDARTRAQDAVGANDALGALRASSTLADFRRHLGLPPRFAEPEKCVLPSWITERSSAILRAKGGFDAPLVDRAREYEKQRQVKLVKLRAEREAAELAELRPFPVINKNRPVSAAGGSLALTSATTTIGAPAAAIKAQQLLRPATSQASLGGSRHATAQLAQRSSVRLVNPGMATRGVVRRSRSTPVPAALSFAQRLHADMAARESRMKSLEESTLREYASKWQIAKVRK